MPKIPDDLKDRHNQLRIWLNSPQQYREDRPPLCTLEDEMQDIERIAALTAVRDSLTAQVDELAGKLADTIKLYVERGDQVEALTKERDALARECERLSEPVSEEWMRKQQPDWGIEGVDNAVRWMNALLAARKQGGE